MLSVPHPSKIYRYAHSRLRRLDVDIDAVREVLESYGLEQTREAHNLPMGRRNRSVVVYTRAGKKVLKLYRPKWPLGSVLCEHSVLARLAQLGIAASRLVPARDGQTCVVRPSGIYSLFDFVEGKICSLTFMPATLRLKLMALAGRTLAHIHRGLEGYVPQGQHHLGFDFYTGSRRPDISWFEERVHELQDKSRHAPAGAARDLAESLVRSSSQVMDELRRLEEMFSGACLPLVVIHGDYGLHNLIVHDSSRLTVVDLELARPEWRLSDLVTALPRLWRSEQPDGIESVGAFVGAYETEYPIEPEEWRLLPHFWKYQNLRASLRYWNSYFDVAPEVERLVKARKALVRAGTGENVVEKLRNSRIPRDRLVQLGCRAELAADSPYSPHDR